VKPTPRNQLLHLLLLNNKERVKKQQIKMPPILSQASQLHSHRLLNECSIMRRMREKKALALVPRRRLKQVKVSYQNFSSTWRKILCPVLQIVSKQQTAKESLPKPRPPPRKKKDHQKYRHLSQALLQK